MVLPQLDDLVDDLNGCKASLARLSAKDRGSGANRKHREATHALALPNGLGVAATLGDQIEDVEHVCCIGSASVGIFVAESALGWRTRKAEAITVNKNTVTGRQVTKDNHARRSKFTTSQFGLTVFSQKRRGGPTRAHGGVSPPPQGDQRFPLAWNANSSQPITPEEESFFCCPLS